MDYTQQTLKHHVGVSRIVLSKIVRPTILQFEQRKDKKLIIKYHTTKCLSAMANRSRVPSIKIQNHNFPLSPLDYTPLTISSLSTARQRGKLYNKDNLGHMYSLEPFKSPLIQSLTMSPVGHARHSPRMGRSPKAMGCLLRNRGNLAKAQSINPNMRMKIYNGKFLGSDSEGVQTGKDDVLVLPVAKIPFLYSSDQEKKMLYERIESKLKYNNLMNANKKAMVSIKLQK
jgi:hypothetical protein